MAGPSTSSAVAQTLIRLSLAIGLIWYLVGVKIAIGMVLAAIVILEVATYCGHRWRDWWT